MQKVKLGAVCLVSTMLLACGGGGGGGGSSKSGSTSGGGESDGLKGVLSDSAVAGVEYVSSPSGNKGITNFAGEYDYEKGDTVVFTIAGLELPPVKAQGRITPQTIAEEIAASAGSDDAQNMALNLAVLFQALDTDGDPSNGIEVSRNTKLTSAVSLDALKGTASEVVKVLEAETLPPKAVVPDVADAAKHFYLNELAGNWRWTSSNDASERFVLIDKNGYFIRVEYNLPTSDTPDGVTFLYTGSISFDDKGVMKTVSNGRALKANATEGAITTENPGRAFDLGVRLSGEQLIFSGLRNGSSVDYPFERVSNVKNSPKGVWAELETELDDEVGTTRNDDGSLDFGEDVIGLFSIYTNNRFIQITLDREAEGSNCEQNGVYVASYTHALSSGKHTVTLGETLINHVWVDPEECDKTAPGKGYEWVVDAISQNNDSVWEQEDDGESIVEARNLSLAERTSGDFKQNTTPNELVGSWRLTNTDDTDVNVAVFNILPDGKYVVGVVHDSSEDCGAGLEYGSYIANSNTLRFSNVSLDTFEDADCGPAGDENDGDTFTITDITEDLLVLTEGEDSLTFERVVNNAAQGSWILSLTGYSAEDRAILSFLPDNSFMQIQYSTEVDSTDTSAGIEYGEYTLVNGVFTVTKVLSDTNGEAGLSENKATGTQLELVVKNESLTFKGDEACFAAVRIENYQGTALARNCN